MEFCDVGVGQPGIARVRRRARCNLKTLSSNNLDVYSERCRRIDVCAVATLFWNAIFFEMRGVLVCLYSFNIYYQSRLQLQMQMQLRTASPGLIEQGAQRKKLIKGGYLQAACIRGRRT